MPLFYFHVHDGIDSRNRTGTSYPDPTAAREAGLRMAGKLLSAQGETFWNGEEWSIDIEDDVGETIYSLKFTANNHSQPR